MLTCILQIILVLFAVVVLTAMTSPNADKDTARVSKIRGKLVFIYCEPLQDYEVVDELNTSMMDALSGQKGTIEEEVNGLLDRALARVKKGKMKDFDGLVTKDLTHGSFVKFKE